MLNSASTLLETGVMAEGNVLDSLDMWQVQMSFLKASMLINFIQLSSLC